MGAEHNNCTALKSFNTQPFSGKMNMLRVLMAAVLMVGAGALELTPDNFDSAVAGKTVFIKFLAPW